jgi:alpha-1,2-mannosyltransferase
MLNSRLLAWLPWLPWTALAIVAAAYYPRFIKPPDAGVWLYSQAANCLLNHQILKVCSEYFTYPPAFAFVFIPLSMLPLWLCLLVWYVVTIAASVAAYKCADVVASRLFPEPFSAYELALVRVLNIVLTAKFVLAVLENQAYEALPLFLITLGLAALSARHELAGGAAIGLAAAIKATPLIFLPYLLVKRRFAAAAAFLAAMLLLSYAPDMFFTPTGAPLGYFHTWLKTVLLGSSEYDPNWAEQFLGGANAMNHSLRGAVSLQIDIDAYPGLHKLVLYGLDLAFIAFAAALIMLRKADRDMLAIDGSILVIGMLMLSPLTSRSHYEVLALPYVTLGMVVLRDRVAKTTGIAVLAASFVLLTLTSNDVVGKGMSDWAYSHSFLVLGALSLMIYISVIVWNPAVLRGTRPLIPPWEWEKRTRT